MTPSNYLFGPFIGELKYELNYFVGHAIYLRKKNPRNKIIVLTRSEHFDFYGKYATTLLPLPLSKELKSSGFSCTNMRVNVFEEILRKFQNKYREKMKIHDHFYPHVTSYLKNHKWYYPRDEVDFDFKTRPRNKSIAEDIAASTGRLIISDQHDHFQKFGDYRITPMRYFRKSLNIDNVPDVSMYGILIEMVRLSKYVYSDIDSILGRIAMLVCKPLITQREVIDAQYLNPINPYGSLVIGCQSLEEGVKYLEGLHENNI